MGEDGKKTVEFAKRSHVPEPRGSNETWKILVADDDDDVLEVTRLVLRHKVVFGRALELLEAKTACEAFELMRETRDVAVILLDVVMETDDAGLAFVRRVRDELANVSTRIVIRTGQPGRAPEDRVIIDYEINDYREKTELTAERLFSSVVNAIRSYRDIRRIEGSKAGMELILEAQKRLIALRPAGRFASGALEYLAPLLGVSHGADSGGVSALVVVRQTDRYRLLAGTGRFDQPSGAWLDSVPFAEAKPLVEAALAGKDPVFAGDRLAVALDAGDGERIALYAEGSPELEDIDRRLIELYCSGLQAAYANLGLYEALEAELEEKSVLMAEIHHRVKNNLQIILSLIGLARLDEEASPDDALRAAERRIAAMAVVHDAIYGQGAATGGLVDFADCANDLVAELRSILGEGAEAPVISLDAGAFDVPLSLAVPCALIVGELLFAGNLVSPRGRDAGPARLRLELRPGPDDYAISVTGAGSAERISELETRLLEALAAQLGGAYSAVENGAAVALSIRFPRAR